MKKFNKVLVIGKGNDLNLALELCGMGYETFYHVDSSLTDANKTGFGFDRLGLNLINDYESLLEKEKDIFVVLSSSDYSDLRTRLLNAGYKVFGSNFQDTSILMKVKNPILSMSKDENVIPETSGVAIAGFFDGCKFLDPALTIYDDERGGYLTWDSNKSLVENSLFKIESDLKEKNYKGIVRMDGSVDSDGKFTFSKLSFELADVCFRVACRMIENLDEVLYKIACGEGTRIKLYCSQAYYINAYSYEPDQFCDLGKIYEIDKIASSKYGITFDSVVLSDDGSIVSLPGEESMFQLVSFGNSYSETVNNIVDLHKIVSKDRAFNDGKQLLIQDIRDKKVFLESWLKGD